MNYQPKSLTVPKTNEIPKNLRPVDLTVLSERKKQIFGAIIYECRKNKGLTQEKLAQQMNCSITTICFIENGKCQDYRLLFLLELANLLEIEPIMTIYFLCMPINPDWDNDKIVAHYLSSLSLII